jgi:hypothetical protein
MECLIHRETPTTAKKLVEWKELIALLLVLPRVLSFRNRLIRRESPTTA